MEKIVWFNLDYYTPVQLGIFAAGAALWIVNYIFIIRNIIKHKFVEMPAPVLCANFAWELLWSWVFVMNMGLAIRLGYMAWFFLDVYIVWNFYRYGHKQVSASIIPYYKMMFTFGLIAWIVCMYFYIDGGFDNPIGAHSAYMSNILISILYITLYLRMDDKTLFSFTTAWTKWLGTGLVTVMCILRWPDNYWLISMGIACFIIDIFYIYLVKKGVHTKKMVMA
jgi:hypothetical protein